MPNAVNSPFRNPTASNGKRSRALVGDVLHGQPPQKKQMLDAGNDAENFDPRRKTLVTMGAQDKLDEPFGKRPPNAQPTDFVKKLAASREKKLAPNAKQAHASAQRAGDGNLDSIRQWQRHYRKQFPSFVFYFESVPDDVRSKAMRDIKILGAVCQSFLVQYGPIAVC